MYKKFNALRKGGYASVETGVTAVELLLQVYLLEYYIRGFGLDPKLVANGAMIAVLWDAFTDPLMGSISDRVKLRFGQRRGFILAGGIVMAIFLQALFNPMQLDNQHYLLIWFTLCYMLVNTGMTIVAVPHIACVGDLTETTSQRNNLIGWRLLFSNLGLLLGIGLPNLLIAEGTITEGRATAAMIIGVILITTSIICYLSIRKFENKPTQSDSNKQRITVGQIISNFCSVVTNRFFFALLVAFALAGAARALNSSFALFYYKDRLLLDEQTQVGIILGLFILCIIGSIPFWLWLGKRYWKKVPAMIGILFLGIGGSILYPLFPVGGVAGPIFMAIFGGVAVGSILLIESLVLDAIDHDEVFSKQRRDGAFFGVWKLSAKVARAIGIGLFGYMLDWTGYNADLEVQTLEASRRIAIVFGVGVGSLFILSGLAFATVRITRAKHEQVKRILIKRNELFRN